jgi:serine/threonine-protein kinase
MTRSSSSAAQRAGRTDESERLASWYTPGLSDAIGDRLLMFDNSTSSSLELLRFRPEFGFAPGFEDALRRRVDELAGFEHPAVARVRAVELLGEDDGLALISNQVVGRRLSEILKDAHGPQFASELVRQLVPVLDALQSHGRGIAHGLLTPERVVVTPEGQLVLTEHVLGSAFDMLRLPAERLVTDLGLVLPPGGLSARLDDPRTDIVQLGYLALSLLVGQRIRSIDSPAEIFGLIDRQSSAAGGQTPNHLQRWIVRALQVDKSPFASAGDAHRALAEWPDHELATERTTIRAPRHLGSSAASAGFSSDRSEQGPSVIVVSGVDSPFLPEVDSPPARGNPMASRHAAERWPAPPANEDWPELTTERRPAAAPVEPRPDTPPPAARWPDVAIPAERWPANPKPEPFSRTEPVRLQMDVRPAPVPAQFEIESAPYAPPRPDRTPAATKGRGQFLQRLVAGLAFVATVEAMIIAGLLASRGTAPSGTAAEETTTPASAATAPVTQAAAPAAAPAARPRGQGRLEVTTEPAGARVSVDGRALGTTPLTASLPPGEHAVVITSGSETTRRTVNVTAGGTAAIVATLAPPVTAGGWVSIDTPLDLQIFERDLLLGTTKADRLMLPAGRHQLRLASAALNFETTLTVDIQAGRTVTTRIAIPNGSLSLNALPWANVWVNGQALGTTPFANVSMPIGTHEIIWRHPQLGERRQSVVLTARTPMRLVVDMRQ